MRWLRTERISPGGHLAILFLAILAVQGVFGEVSDSVAGDGSVAAKRRLVFDMSDEEDRKKYEESVGRRGEEEREKIQVNVVYSDHDMESVWKMLDTLAEEFGDDLIFQTTDVDMMDVDPHPTWYEDWPIIIFKHSKNPEITLPFRPEKDDLEIGNLRKFIEDFLDDKLKPNLTSEEVPEDWDSKPVKILTAKNFEEVALDLNKHVFVKFYAEWCDYCKSLAPEFEKLAEELADREDIVIAHMNGEKNKLEHFATRPYPIMHLFRKGDNKLIEFNGVRKAKKILRFLLRETKNPVLDSSTTAWKEWNFQNRDRPRNIFTLSLSYSQDGAKDKTAMLNSIAKDYEGRVEFVTQDTDKQYEKEEGMWITKRTTNEYIENTYLPESMEPEEQNIRKFVDDFQAGRVKPELKSEEVPADWDAKPVKVLTGKNFEAVALDPSKNVFVKFYAPWCGHCQEMAADFEAAALDYTDNVDIIFAEMDGNKNTLEHYQTRPFPTLTLFLKGSNDVVPFTGQRTKNGFKRFLRKFISKKNSKANGDHDEL